MLSQLNPQQRDAVKYLDGPLLVLAGAGSGKTRVITQKMAYMIQECGYLPASITAITFTNKAAREMQNRVAKLLHGKSKRGLTVTTFHSLCLHILRQEAVHIGYKPKFSILDSADSQHILQEILKTTDKSELKGTQNQISLWKNSLIDADAAWNGAQHELEQRSAHAYRAYQGTLHAYQSMDFDDLIFLAVKLFETKSEVLEKWRNKIRYLLIDEYQDTNVSQYRLVKAISGASGNFTAVGDDDQSIYGWRGASANNMRGLSEDYSRLHLIKLEQNYRSTIRILRLANSLIAHNPRLFEKKLWSDLGLGDHIQVLAAKDEEHEAETIIMRLLAHKFEHQSNFADYAILYRGNHQARVFEQILRNERVPYQLSGGSSFFERAEIKDIIAYMRLLTNSEDDPAFIRAVITPKKGVGTQTLEKLGNYAAQRHLSLFTAAFEAGLETQLGEGQHQALMIFCNFINKMQHRAEREPAGDILQDLLKAINYETYLFDSEDVKPAQNKWNNVMDFVAWLTKKGEQEDKSILALTQTIALLNILENNESTDVDAVRLSTLHAAKGLEYPYVYLIGAEEGILPHRECIENNLIEEERRLMYVGITRAQRSLTLSYSQKRKRGREWQVCEPSRFIGEMAQEDLHLPGRESTAEEKKLLGTDRLAQIKEMLKSKPGEPEPKRT